MSVGDSALIAGLSYLAFGRETVTGSYNTCTAGLNFMSASFKTMKENRAIEEINGSRAYNRNFQNGKVVEGELEFLVEPRRTAFGYMLQNWMGGTVTSATATGETAGAGASSAMTHTFILGNMDQSYASLCVNHRKGPATGGKVFNYSGAKVNELTFNAEINEPLVASASLICFDSTQVSNDVEAAIVFQTATALSFVAGRLSIETAFASLTTTSFWHMVSVEFGHSNNLKADDDSRRIGSDILAVLPASMIEFTLNARVRFNTTTAYDAMMASTELAAELEFLGPTLPGSAIRQGLKFQYPKVIVADAGDPEVSGPNEMLMSDVKFLVLKDDSSATGYAMRCLLTNNTTSI